MAHFPALHRPGHSAVLEASQAYPVFERRLREHLRKLIHVRSAQRYLAKANAQVPRLRYLLRLFPDARFVVPIRQPLTHVGSLVKQDRLLSAMGRANPAVRRHLRRTGHLEFGLDKQVPEVGDVEAARVDFAEGCVAAGYARIWNSLYGHLAEQLQLHSDLRAAVCVVRFEDLCAAPHGHLQRVFEHVGLHDQDATDLIERSSAELSEPDYYQSPLNESEQQQVQALTAATRARFGYGH